MSNAPTATYRQHVDEVEAPRVDASAFRQGWRVRTRLDALLADGRITTGEWQAAVEYREAAARTLGVPPGALLGGLAGAGGADPHRRMTSLLDSLGRLRTTEAAIGRLATALCVACAVLDLSWAKVGRAIGRNPETARNWTAAAIGRLADAWNARAPGARAWAARRGGLPARGLGPESARRRVRPS